MDIKTIILVIILSAIVGFMIFFGVKFFSGNNIASSNFQSSSLSKSSLKPTAKPTPVPTYLPLDSNSNLGDEVNKLTPPDFSNDYKQLKDAVNK